MKKIKTAGTNKKGAFSSLLSKKRKTAKESPPRAKKNKIKSINNFFFRASKKNIATIINRIPIIASLSAELKNINNIPKINVIIDIRSNIKYCNFFIAFSVYGFNFLLL